MHHLNEKQRRETIVQYKETHPQASNYAIAKYFKELGISGSTTYSVLTMYAERGNTSRASGSGRPVELMPSKHRKRLVKEAKNSVSPSQRRLASKYGVSQPYVCKILHEEGLHSYKKTKVPKVTEKQEEIQRLRIGRLYRHILDEYSSSPSIVMDDESYFELSGYQMPGNDHYYATTSKATTSSHQFMPREKFGLKILVWVAISDRGISRIYCAPSGGALNAQTYKTKCIRQRLKPFLDTHHMDGNYLFWPDLASCHYAKETIAVLEELGINYVSKDMNPPNCPQLRPIEDFWGWLKQIVYDKGWTASNLDQLKTRVKYSITKVDISSVRRMMIQVKSEIRKARAQGATSVLH